MADPTVPPTLPQRPPMPKEQQERFVNALFEALTLHQEMSTEVRDLLQAHAKANPHAPITQGLVDIIKQLCDCKAIVAILECLCKFLTGG
jgi:polysaccharide pyruvyl transferase WcaK-like protein